MGPHGVDHAPDYVAELAALVASHPTLTYIRPPSPGGPHMAVWDDDDGHHRETREHLGDLVAFVRASLGRHKAEPLTDSAYTMEGPRTGRLLDLRFARCFPAQGLCSCGMVVRRESRDDPWVHTGRKPGES